MSSHNPRDPMLPLGSDKCRCSACHEYFNSSWAFAQHRVGPFAPINAPNTRRCLTVSEMQAQGWSRNQTGRWITRKRTRLAFTRDVGAAIALSGYWLAGDVLAATAPLRDGSNEQFTEQASNG